MKMIVQSWRITFVAFLLMIADICRGHSIVSLVVPAIADPRENAILTCRYDMEKDHLFSTKWYKNEQEIFRYMPTQTPQGLSFEVDAVHLVKTPRCSQVACDIELKDLTPASAGLYKCEVSTEAPTFRIKHKSANLTVAALLRRDPLVEGASTSYAQGDEVRVNCTSDPSLPAADVTWYINDVEATYPFVEAPSETRPDAMGLSTKSLGLRFRADRQHFIARVGTASPALKLRCVSSMPSWIPGGPHTRQYTITAALRHSQLNQRLEWMGSPGVMTSGCPPLLMAAAALMFLKAAFQRRPQVVY